MDSTTIFLFNQDFTSLDFVNLILNTVLALAAILAVIISAYTFRKERYSRRALITPTDEPGYLKYGDDKSSNGVMLIKLKNYGINPANNVRCSILFFNESENENNENEITICHFFKDDFHFFNPLAHLAEFNIKSVGELFQTLLDFGLVKYLLLDISYFDKQLKRDFKDRFVWLINVDGSLVEVPRNVYRFMESFTYNKKDLEKMPEVIKLL
jgi:hypothetical protein